MINKRVCVRMFCPTCLRLTVFSGLPVFAKIILEVTDYFSAPEFKKIAERSHHTGIQVGLKPAV